MQRKFLLNLILLLSLNLLVKPFWILGIDLTVQNTVGSADYGFYFSLLNFSFLFNILLDFGITNYNNRNIAQNRQLLQKHFSNIVSLRLLLAVIYLLITFGVAISIDYSATQMKMLAFLTLNQFLLSFILYLRSNIAALHLFRIDSFISVLDRLLMIGICSVLLWGNVVNQEFQIEWFVYAQTLAYALTFAFAFYHVSHRAGSLSFSFKLPFSLMILKQSAPYALLVLLMMLYYKVDSVMLERMLDHGQQQAGVYATAYRLLDAANNISYLFAALLLPIFARMIKLKQPVHDLMRLALNILFVMSVTVLMFSLMYSTELMSSIYPQHAGESQALFDQRIAQSSLIFQYLMGCFVAMSVTYVFGTLLTANGSMKQLNLVAGGGMILNVVLNLILIPGLESVGSAIASLITQGLTSLAQVMIAVMVFRLKFDLTYLTRFVAFVFGVLALVVWQPQISELWPYNAVFVVALAILWAFILRLISIKQFIHILQFSPEEKGLD
ncbi:MAG: oligosaccharide flippase family protein [Bacteroidales bacterium]